MNEFSVKFQSITDAKSFCSLCEKLPYDVDVMRGRYVVDGCSLLGILSYDISEPMRIVIHCDNLNDLNYQNFKLKCQPWMVA